MMRFLRNAFIALPMMFIVMTQAIPALRHGAMTVAIASIFALVTGNVSMYVNPSSVSSTPCGASGALTCAPGNDGNLCISNSAPCKTFQHAAYLMTQTLVWGVNVGSAQIFLGDGTMNEDVSIGGVIGIPKVCASCEANFYPGMIEIIGDDANPSNVTLSGPNGGCATTNAVLAFLGPGYFTYHGFGITAINEVTNGCSDVAISKGAYVFAQGTMIYGPPAVGSAGGANTIQVDGVYNGALGTIDAELSSGRASNLFQTHDDGIILQDVSTINWVGTNSLSGGLLSAEPAVYSFGQPGGYISLMENVTFTGTVSGTCVFMNAGREVMEGAANTQNTSFGGCTPPTTVGARVGNGALIGDTLVIGKLATNHGSGGFLSSGATTITGCGGSGAFINATATDVNGTFGEGSGATGCTVVFYEQQPVEPDCTVQSWAGAGLSYSLNQSGGKWVGFTVTNIGSLAGTTLTYHCIMHS